MIDFEHCFIIGETGQAHDGILETAHFYIIDAFANTGGVKLRMIEEKCSTSENFLRLARHMLLTEYARSMTE